MKTTFIFSHNTASGTFLWVLRGIKTFRNHLTTYESEIKFEYNTQPLISFQVLGCSLRHWEGNFHNVQIHWVPRFKVLSKYWGWKDIQRISRDANASLFVNKETKILQNVLSYEGPIANTLKYFITPNVGLTIIFYQHESSRRKWAPKNKYPVSLDSSVIIHSPYRLQVD